MWIKHLFTLSWMLNILRTTIESIHHFGAFTYKTLLEKITFFTCQETHRRKRFTATRPIWATEIVLWALRPACYKSLTHRAAAGQCWRLHRTRIIMKRLNSTSDCFSLVRDFTRYTGAKPDDNTAGHKPAAFIGRYDRDHLFSAFVVLLIQSAIHYT